MKKILMLFIAAMIVLPAVSDDRIETTISGDFVNQYIWRGQDLGNVSIQPTLGLSWKGLSLGAWGSVGISNFNDTKEFDITASYSYHGFGFGITDYWFSTGGDPDNRYFKYSSHATNHIFEAFISYDFGFLGINWFTNFAGNDGMNKEGKRAYSSYFELYAPFHLGGMDWTATAGATPYASTLYGSSGFAVTNLSVKATKDIIITDSFTVPIFAAITANPCSQKAYLVFGFTLRP